MDAGGGGLAWLAGRRFRSSLLVGCIVAAGWATATFVALTMHGWWFPGRQVIVVLPLVAAAIASWASRRSRVLVGRSAWASGLPHHGMAARRRAVPAAHAGRGLRVGRQSRVRDRPVRRPRLHVGHGADLGAAHGMAGRVGGRGMVGMAGCGPGVCRAVEPGDPRQASECRERPRALLIHSDSTIRSSATTQTPWSPLLPAVRPAAPVRSSRCRTSLPSWVRCLSSRAAERTTPHHDDGHR